jgi:hypothetical protein
MYVAACMQKLLFLYTNPSLVQLYYWRNLTVRSTALRTAKYAMIANTRCVYKHCSQCHNPALITDFVQ